MNKSKINILIVEDSEDDLYFIKKALAEDLYNIETISSGTAAYNYLLNPEIKPSIVLLDYKLPGMTGLEILERINKHEHSYSFIFLTIDNTIETVVKAMKAGALDFIVKSTDLKNELPEKVQKVYEIHCAKTEKKQIELALKESEAKFRTIFESSKDAIGISKNGFYLFSNRAYLKLFGYESPEEIVGHSILEQISPKEHQKVKKYVANRNKNKAVPSFYETIGIRKNGEEFPFEVTVGTYILSNEKYSIAIIRDISERKQAEQIIKQQNTELQKLNTDKDRFIQILAHDLKSPFNSLLGFSDLLSKNIRQYDITRIENFVNIINQSTHNTYNLLNDILLWIKAQSGQLHINPVKINFREVCLQIIDDLKLTSGNKNISINCLSEDKTTIIGDLNMLNTVLRNLISNAIKFTHIGGQINIKTEQSKEKTIITVSDNGVGIDAETLNKLFDITEKITTAGTENEKGTGLGLLLCKEFIEKHGGKIWIKSEVGKGSDFKFSVPNQEL